MANLAGMRGEWPDVARAVKSVFGGEEFVLLAEDGDAIKPPHFERGNSIDESSRLPRGRAFNKKCEVRWRETAEKRYIITYLSEDDPPPTDSGFSQSEDTWETRETSQKLYGKLSALPRDGKWSDDEGENSRDWVEVSVPGVSRNYYQPLLGANEWPNSLEVATVDYIRDSIVQMTRFCQVRRYPQ